MVVYVVVWTKPRYATEGSESTSIMLIPHDLTTKPICIGAR